jgi:hypothetical protein
MNNKTKTILSLLLFFPFGIYFYTEYKAINIYYFTILLIIGLFIFLPIWTIVFSQLLKIVFSFQNNVLLPLISKLSR